MNKLIIFDLDGVITSEEAYWDTAGLVLHELLYSPRYWSIARATSYRPPLTPADSHQKAEEVLPFAVIIDLKARAINSNWDTCYTGVCLNLLVLLASIADCTTLLPLQPERADWIAAFRQQLAASDASESLHDLYRRFNAPAFEGYTGLDFLERFNAYATELLGSPVEGIFARYSPFWLFCQNLFQEWYLGDNLYERTYDHRPAQCGKIGCIHFERPLLPIERIRTTLEALCTQGYTLGVATGRPGEESILPLKSYGILHYFDERRIVTHAEVARAEAQLQAEGEPASLVKPHPYQFMLAAQPGYDVRLGNGPQPGSFLIVGDTSGDMRGGRAAGALTIAVLTGARTPEARHLLEESEPDFIIDDMTELPALLAQIENLATIQRLQFSERAKAERLLQWWFHQRMHLSTDSVTLVPKAVSLNSFNGFYRAGDEEYFFKTHVEEQGVIEEYYHAERLRNAGYAIVLPVRTMHEQGQQMVIYPVISCPVMFDLMREVETGKTERATAELLVAAERRECERLVGIYQSTLASSTAAEHERAPIHQLFWHRLAGERLKTFYVGKSVPLLSHTDAALPFEQLLRLHWRINGVSCPATLGQLIERAMTVLNPARAASTVIGHGDAHFGNVFLEEQRSYLYFDPAFAGRHSPLLDIVKPLFHNIFATWMYFPHEIAQTLEMSVYVQDDTLCVEHNYALTAVRRAILQTKLEQLVMPLLAWLREEDALPADWQTVLQSALLCCPLLTINLLDAARLPVAMSWLGFTLTVLMGHFDILSASTDGLKLSLPPSKGF